MQPTVDGQVEDVTASCHLANAATLIMVTNISAKRKKNDTKHDDNIQFKSCTIIYNVP